MADNQLLQRSTGVEGNAIDLMVRQSGSLSAFWHSCQRSDWMLAALDEGVRNGIVTPEARAGLRRFACWCAIEAGADAQDVLLVYAMALADGRTPSRAFRAERQQRQSWVAAVGAQGLSRCIPVAAAALAAWYAGDDDACLGARCAADFAVKASVFGEAEMWAPSWLNPDDHGEPWRIQWHTAAWLRAHRGLAARIRETTHERLARGLRVVISNPFDRRD